MQSQRKSHLVQFIPRVWHRANNSLTIWSLHSIIYDWLKWLRGNKEVMCLRMLCWHKRTRAMHNMRYCNLANDNGKLFVKWERLLVTFSSPLTSHLVCCCIQKKTYKCIIFILQPKCVLNSLGFYTFAAALIKCLSRAINNNVWYLYKIEVH